MKKRILGLLTALMLVLPMFPALPVAAAEVPEGTENLSGTFDGIDGGTVSTQSEGKPKLVIFFKLGCSNCERALASISSSEWIKSGEIDVCAFEMNCASVDDVKAFRDQYCPEGTLSLIHI